MAYGPWLENYRALCRVTRRNVSTSLMHLCPNRFTASNRHFHSRKVSIDHRIVATILVNGEK